MGLCLYFKIKNCSVLSIRLHMAFQKISQVSGLISSSAFGDKKSISTYNIHYENLKLLVMHEKLNSLVLMDINKGTKLDQPLSAMDYLIT